MTASKAQTNCVLVFSKPPLPGRVKTRLVGPLSSEAAARLHAAFLQDLWVRLTKGPFDLRIAWALEPGDEVPETPAPGERQEGRDLGERLFHALAGAARQYPRVAAVGSDHPDLPVERVVEAFERLDRGAGVVVGPATDGGYYLVAARREALRPELFAGIPWSTSEVLATTLERCAAHGLTFHELPEGRDVDTPADLRRLVATLEADSSLCPRTREVLVEEGWL